MSANRADIVAEDPQSQFEQACIDEFLRGHGYQRGALGRLPDAERDRVMKQASIYASGKLAEVEARAHFIHEMHRGGEEPRKPVRT